MKLSRDRILTTHVGSLPRALDLSDMLLRKEFGEAQDEAAFEIRVREAVTDVVTKQVAAGSDIVSNGEMSKIGYATYIKDRCEGGFPATAPAARRRTSPPIRIICRSRATWARHPRSPGPCATVKSALRNVTYCKRISPIYKLR